MNLYVSIRPPRDHRPVTFRDAEVPDAVFAVAGDEEASKV
jgi:hypothetical protein